MTISIRNPRPKTCNCPRLMQTNPPAKATLTVAVLLFCGLLGLPLAAQGATANPPETMSYQGVLVDANGAKLGSPSPASYDVVFKIYDASSAGTVVWAEKQRVTVDNGYFSVLLGSGAALPASTGLDGKHGNLSAVFAGSAASDRYIGITVTITGQTDTEITPRLQLVTSPFSFLARQANTIVDTSGNALITSTAGAVNVTALNVTGTVTASGYNGPGTALTSLNANNISQGTLNEGRISSLAATKLTGTISSDRLGDVPASKLSGTIANARLGTDVALTSNANIQFSGRVKDKTGDIMPVGTILPYAGSTAPGGWLVCDGSAQLRAGAYADLFAAIGTTYGKGDNLNTFNIPDLRARVPVGKSADAEFNSLGKTGGEKTHTLTTAEMPSHNHYLVSDNTYVTLLGNDSGDLFDHGASGGSIHINNQYSTPTTQNTGGGAAHNILQPYITLNYIIKY